jgi:hypothetical protein
MPRALLRVALAAGGGGMTATASRRRKPAAFRLQRSLPEPKVVVREHPTQRATCDFLTREIAKPAHVSPHGVVWFALDLAAYSERMPYTHIRRGCVSGLADIWLLWAGRCAVIELKAEDGILGERQQEIAAAFSLAGVRYGVACSVDGVLELLDTWSVPRRHMIEPTRRAA